MYFILDAIDGAHAVPAGSYATLCGTPTHLLVEWIDPDDVGDNDGGICPTCAQAD